MKRRNFISGAIATVVLWFNGVRESFGLLPIGFNKESALLRSELSGLIRSYDLKYFTKRTTFSITTLERVLRELWLEECARQTDRGKPIPHVAFWQSGGHAGTEFVVLVKPWKNPHNFDFSQFGEFGSVNIKPSWSIRKDLIRWRDTAIRLKKEGSQIHYLYA